MPKILTIAEINDTIFLINYAKEGGGYPMKRSMMQRSIAAIFFGLLTTALLCHAVTAAEAERTWSGVYIDDDPAYFDAYNINGNNYFKLRDIAYVLSGSAKRFDVTWDGERNAVNIISDREYNPVGGEMEVSSSSKSRQAEPSSAAIYLDGREIHLTAYNIGGNNYFKLRDLGEALDFSVEWDSESNAVYIETAYGYVPEGAGSSYEFIRDAGVKNTNATYINRWAYCSSVQQFLYMDEGLAYAYMKEGMLEIVTPSKHLSVETRYPILGDVISDEDGNFYVVWGKANKTDEYDTDTVFISKYSADGKHKKTTGFEGKSVMGDSGNTKVPFEAGKCVSAIGNGYLMVNYARTMYSGHQSNNVIGVKISNMSPVTQESKWNIPYTSHSFNQSIVWYDSGFIYADQGDAYDRGFIITDDSGEKNIFHFYLQANADYDMYIVNETFAQMGGLVKTNRGLGFVGASAKSISENAKEEPQNLFVQIFKPNKKLSSSMFVGGEKRRGATSTDINDNKNAPLEQVTDYGVHWLTNYTDRDVIAPHAAAEGNKIIILWNERGDNGVEAYYTVLTASGDVVTPASSLGKVQLNSFEDPIYYNGRVYWACAHNGSIRVLSIDV